MSHLDRQYVTFTIGNQLCGIQVDSVQEVVRDLPMTEVLLARPYVKGLINLRGQIATAIDLRELFGINAPSLGNPMNIICRIDGTLLSLLVDAVGEVVDASEEHIDLVPEVVSAKIRRFLSGVYKMSEDILSIVETGSVLEYLNQENATP